MCRTLLIGFALTPLSNFDENNRLRDILALSWFDIELTVILRRFHFF
jgi:hypothetical protein